MKNDEALVSLYGAEDWPREARQMGQCERFAIPLDLFEQNGFRLMSRDSLPGVRRAYRSYYVHETNDKCRIVVDIVPTSSFDAAKEALLTRLSYCAQIVPRLEGVEEGVPQVGDIAYGGTGARQFVRNNVVITVANAGLEDVDITSFSQALDEAVINNLR